MPCKGHALHMCSRKRTAHATYEVLISFSLPSNEQSFWRSSWRFCRVGWPIQTTTTRQPNNSSSTSCAPLSCWWDRSSSHPPTNTTINYKSILALVWQFCFYGWGDGCDSYMVIQYGLPPLPHFHDGCSYKLPSIILSTPFLIL